MNELLHKDIMSETFVDYNDLLWKIVWRTWCYFGGDIDELRAEANLHFVEAYNKLLPDNRHHSSSWIYRRVFDKLFGKRRKEVRKRINTTNLDNCSDVIAKKKSNSFRYSLILDSLSEDAQYVVKLAFVPGVTDEDLERGFNGRDTRMSIKRHLQAINWTGLRIKNSFREIRRLECWY